MTFSPSATGRSTSMLASSTLCVFSIMTTLSAPAGIMPPVCTRTASPTPISMSLDRPMGTSPVTDKKAGRLEDAP